MTERDIEKKTKLLYYSAWRRVLTKSVLGKSVWNNALNTTKTGPRGGKQFICSVCGESFGAGKLEIEHTDCVVDLRLSTDIMGWDYIFDRINTIKLTLCCKNCHKIKTAFEVTERKRLKTVMKHMICRVKGGGEIKVISMVDLREFDTVKYEVIDVKDTFEEADKEVKRRIGSGYIK